MSQFSRQKSAGSLRGIRAGAPFGQGGAAPGRAGRGLPRSIWAKMKGLCGER